MRNERPTTPPPDAIATQRAATDPQASAWVNANAGSGKTFVLTRRVIRLLLSGAAPETILCLTYTKAAAAEMRHRVSEILGGWTLLDDQRLGEVLGEMLGEWPDAGTMTRARELFALALETPGGLKINTIHAFCEAVLQRFPYEAGVPVNFAVIEDADRNQMILDAREAVLAEGLGAEGPLGEAARRLFSRLGDHAIEKAVAGALGLGRRLEPILADPAAAKANLFARLGIGPEVSVAAVRTEMIAGMIVTSADWPEIFAIAPPEPGKTRFEDKLAALDPDNPDPMKLAQAYLKADGTVPSGFPKKAFGKANPALAANLLAEAERLASLLDLYRASEIAEQSAALLDVLSAIIARYEAQKRARSWLDFDDLVVRTAALFANPDYGAWVRYKLDAGIDHILVDESQDTNPEQWQVIEALAGDFFDGEGTGRPKTLFAVGDPKQSIYSFQGAEPALFLETGRKTRRKAKNADRTWHDLTLRTSFRTLPAILDGVDAVANRPGVRDGLLAGDSPVRHESARNDKGGTITLWPVIAPPETIATEGDWPLEPVENLASAPRQLARRIARTIGHWVTQKAPLGPRRRAIVPEDVLVLVQRRSAIFGEIVRALKEERIESPGADRLPVSAHIAVDDLLGLADVLLNPGDGLTLAAILRSPLFGLSENDLYQLAHPRGNLSLWQGLQTSPLPAAQDAYGQLSALRQRLDLDRPYEFFAHVLYAQGGLRRFHQRLGAEVDEVIAEFLDLALEHEKSDQPSLTGFIAAMRKSDIVIKRDLVAKTSGVRVMTVHGAKGLEAPLVILADSAAKPPPVKDCVFAGPPDAPFLLYCPSKDNHCAASLPLREAVSARQDAEYWRNLYVAMTRAEDGLVLAGCLARPTTDVDKALTGSWLGAARDAFAKDAATLLDPVLGENVMRFPASAPDPAPITHAAEGGRDAETPFALSPLTPVQPREIISPSGIGAALPAEDGFVPDAERLLDAATARDKGIALHALLQHLTSVPHHLRAEVAAAAAQTLLPDAPELAGPVTREALAILGDPALAAIFGPDARAEVSFALDATRNGAPVRLAGRIDRLVADEEGITIVDFKSDAMAPEEMDGVPEAYWVQLGLYARVAARLFPGQRVTTAILWTTPRRLMMLDPARLARASAAIALV
ncbi:double-strand break repair helicase AddA [Pelagibacterium sediminicola]|uniref:double-strand break repair helicase AddA n=1 Tax=Pelagibacterium sediminicola TaxID=2248761 RepID=UPI00130066F1|nr:double-strand break repair helicase AddA [Pelagibacterium sediminicola]